MVLRLKTRESRSLPGLLKAIHAKSVIQSSQTRKPTARAETKGRPQSGLPSFWGKGRQRQTCRRTQTVRILGDAGWSSPVARQAHNLKAAGSNPAPATNTFPVFPPCDRPASLVELLRTPIPLAYQTVWPPIRAADRRPAGLSPIPDIPPLPGRDREAARDAATKRKTAPLCRCPLRRDRTIPLNRNRCSAPTLAGAA
jgi:hypothetical protein